MYYIINIIGEEDTQTFFNSESEARAFARLFENDGNKIYLLKERNSIIEKVEQIA